MKRKECYRVYIDESGDEGFTWGTKHSSSEWLTLSAVITRTENDLSLVELMRTCRRSIGKPENYTIHFRDLNHQQRLAILAHISTAQIRLVSVICQKQFLEDTEYLREKHRLYFYLTRFVFERVSWLCKEHRHADPMTALSHITFSNRSSMSYDEIRAYMNQLRGRSDVKIDWDAIDPERIDAVPHRQRAGLQVADAVASGHFYAFEKSPYGFTEDRYARMLLPVAYRHRKSKSVLGFGIKIFPAESLKQVRQNGAHDWIPGLPIKKAGPGPEDPTP